MKRWITEGDHLTEVKDLSRSKWSNDLDDDHTEGVEAVKKDLNSRSVKIGSRRKEAKAVRWSDQVSLTSEIELLGRLFTYFVFFHF